jgi:hypothetical protein
MKDMKMEDALKERKKKALAVTILIPMQKGDEMDDDMEEKEDEETKAVDLAPELDEEKETKKALLKGQERELMRKKAEGVKPKGLEERALMAMMED